MPFVAATLYLLTAFAWALSQRQIRSGVASYAIVTAICAVGLLRMTTWARTLALVAALGITGIGVLSVLAAVFLDGNAVGPLVMVGVGVVSTVWLARPALALPGDTDD